MSHQTHFVVRIVLNSLNVTSLVLQVNVSAALFSRCPHHKDTHAFIDEKLLPGRSIGRRSTEAVASSLG